jgi:hypothetical protein
MSRRSSSVTAPRPNQREADVESDFLAACLHTDITAANAILATHPELLKRREHFTRPPNSAVLMSSLSCSIWARRSKSRTPTARHCTSQRADARDVATLLIERGAEIDPRETQWGNTPLDTAVHFGLTAMIDLLAVHSRDIWNLVFTGRVDRVRVVLDADPSLACGDRRRRHAADVAAGR